MRSVQETRARQFQRRARVNLWVHLGLLLVLLSATVMVLAIVAWGGPVLRYALWCVLTIAEVLR